MRSFFEKIIGNENTKARLSSSVLKNTVPHAFLFVGSHGSGKHTLAKELAAALNCENKKNGAFNLPCHICNTCRRINEGLFTDIHYIKRESGKMSLGVGVIEKMREDIILSATESDYKIYIVEEAEKITPQAQNAMLTILEEPPDGVIIILLAEEADNILTTVKSRVQTVRMERFSDADILNFILKRSERAQDIKRTDHSVLDAIISSSGGRIGQALSLTEDVEAAEEIKERRKTTEAFIDAVLPGASFLKLYRATLDLPSGRIEFKAALEDILSALRDLILLKYDENVTLTFFTSRHNALALSAKINIKRLFKLYDIISQALEDNSRNANMSAQTANLAAQIKLS